MTSSHVGALSRASTLHSRLCPLSPFSPSVQCPSLFSPAGDPLLPLSSFPPVNPHLPSSLPSPPLAIVPSILLRLPHIVGSSLLRLCCLRRVVQLLSLLWAPARAESCQQKPSAFDVPVLSLPSLAPPCCVSVVSGASSSCCLFSEHLQKPEAASKSLLPLASLSSPSRRRLLPVASLLSPACHQLLPPIVGSSTLSNGVLRKPKASATSLLPPSSTTSSTTLVHLRRRRRRR